VYCIVCNKVEYSVVRARLYSVVRAAFYSIVRENSSISPFSYTWHRGVLCCQDMREPWSRGGPCVCQSVLPVTF
jgi:hypothetical protein